MVSWAVVIVAPGQRSLLDLKLLRSCSKLPQQKLTAGSLPLSSSFRQNGGCFEDGGNSSDFGGFGKANTLVR